MGNNAMKRVPETPASRSIHPAMTRVSNWLSIPLEEISKEKNIQSFKRLGKCGNLKTYKRY
tara:strand:- start:91 stop:273 length:183 start_codon:yes stop_codon:yes gene_type:complete